MPERIPTTLETLYIGDYVEGQGGVVWKVTHARAVDGIEHLGITNAEGGRKIVPVTPGTPIIRLEYGTPLTEEQAIEAIPGNVLVTHDGPNWFHPPHSAFDENEHMLRGHLVRFHFAALAGLDPAEARLGDLVVIHHAEHDAGKSDHTHGE